MRVAVLEDHLLTREGVIRVLIDGGVEVIAAVDEPTALLRAVATEHPDAVVLDVRLPPTFTDEGLKVARAVRRTYPDVAVLVLSQYTDAGFVESLLGAEESSVGYLLKGSLLETDALHDALRRVVRGECVVDPAVVAELFRNRARPFSSMTAREVDVLGCIAEGLTNGAIATRLTISERTVEVHIQHIFEKLGLADNPQTNKRVLAALSYIAAGR